MARIRTIKPSFFLDDRLCDLDPLTRILFAGLWCQADGHGRLEDRPRRIKAEVLPYDDCDLDAMLDALDRDGFVHRYEVGGARYIEVCNFRKHQRISGDEASAKSEFPAPPTTKQRRSNDEAVTKQSRSSHEAPVAREGKGREGKGELLCASAPAVAPAVNDNRPTVEARPADPGPESAAPLPAPKPPPKQRAPSRAEAFAAWYAEKRAALTYEPDRPLAAGRINKQAGDLLMAVGEARAKAGAESFLADTFARGTKPPYSLAAYLSPNVWARHVPASDVAPPPEERKTFDPDTYTLQAIKSLLLEGDEAGAEALKAQLIAPFSPERLEAVHGC